MNRMWFDCAGLDSKGSVRVEAWTSAIRRPARPSLSKWSDGRGVGYACADDSAGQARRSAARCQRPRSTQRHLLCALDRLPVESPAEGFAAQKHGALLLHAVGLGPHAWAYPSRSLCRSTRAGRARSQPDSGHHRQSNQQSGSKRGSALDPQADNDGSQAFPRDCCWNIAWQKKLAASSFSSRRATSPFGRYCCKCLFASTNTNFPGRTRGDRIIIWGTT